jgi:hypothetical protein
LRNKYEPGASEAVMDSGLPQAFAGQADLHGNGDFGYILLLM